MFYLVLLCADFVRNYLPAYFGSDAGLGLVAGAGAGKIQANASQVSFGKAKAVPMFNNVQPGATAGNIAGNSTNAVTSVTDTVN